ncbi:VUT family protein [Sinorhizobium medicae]|nr:VUT family protein [Sinorhizobium medicae]MDX0623215.1 VUT family protein [Sinorhizobium medicae]MDX0641961.1 VUT family protein [Sinorhizobium medicae]MDX0666401.1 VUT family protein [Sinorhizobium medicae]MDX0679616.1 VUT family protein [Sinorhizobium medicae]
MKADLAAAAIVFAATIPAANWMIGNVGTCLPDGPCTVPVGFGLEAPSGVLMIGLALVVRDLVHEKGDLVDVLNAIALGGVVSALVAPPALAVASTVAFLAGEFADLAVYAPLRRRRLWLAVGLSGIAGAIIDSAMFLWLAFGSLDLVGGQIVGKTYASVAAAAAVCIRRRAAG